MKKSNFANWKKHGFEYFSIFIAVLSAFVLNNWNENRRDSNSESKILIEIANGLEKDIVDTKLNIKGHKAGISASNYFIQVINNKKVNTDSIMMHYQNLTRDFVSIQNIAGYETLKSKGLELIKNDSLRLSIISLYEYDYNILKKLEEEYTEMQFYKNYFKEINDQLAPNFLVNSDGSISSINFPLEIQDTERKKLLLYLWKINDNRSFILNYYTQVEKKIIQIREKIKKEINIK